MFPALFPTKPWPPTDRRKEGREGGREEENGWWMPFSRIVAGMGPVQRGGITQGTENNYRRPCPGGKRREIKAAGGSAYRV
jgi:hypothetical protein